MAGGNPTVAGPLCYLLTGSIIVPPPVVSGYLLLFKCISVPLLLDLPPSPFFPSAVDGEIFTPA